ncbi:MAG: hypothetical protein PHD05_09835, partial [Sphaerochaetaceae bacterium]|nr:hypothetical protein [Sphaerochaetaceae bacterium]
MVDTKKLFIFLFLILLIAFVFAKTFTVPISVDGSAPAVGTSSTSISIVSGERAFTGKVEDKREVVTLELDANPSFIDYTKAFNAKMILEFLGKNVLIKFRDKPADAPIARSAPPNATVPVSSGPTGSGDISSFTFSPSKESDLSFDVSKGEGAITGMAFFIIPDANKDKYKISKSGQDQDFNITKVGTNLYRMYIVRDAPIEHSFTTELPVYVAHARNTSDNLPNIRAFLYVNLFSKDSKWNNDDYLDLWAYQNNKNFISFLQIKDGNLLEMSQDGKSITSN